MYFALASARHSRYMNCLRSEISTDYFLSSNAGGEELEWHSGQIALLSFCPHHLVSGGNDKQWRPMLP
jgi:hypothetical protein